MTVQPELVLIGLAALVPALVAGAVLVRVVRPVGPAWVGALVAFAWGTAVATSVAAVLNDLAGTLLPTLVGSIRAAVLLPTLVGPTIEELTKAAGFVAIAVVAGPALSGIRGALATGALIGFGFAVAENVGYYTLAAVQGGYDGLGRAIYLRGIVESGNHAAFTATMGAAVGWVRVHALDGMRRTGILVLGLVAAIALHALWNGVVSQAVTTVLCNAPVAGGACAAVPDTDDLLLVVPALEAAFLVPIVAVLGWLARRTA